MDANVNPIYKVNVMSQNQLIVFGPVEDSLPPNEHLKYSNQRIHPDDTIETIKRKILVELPFVSYDELYLFANVQPFLTIERTVQLLTCGHRVPLSRDRLITLCQNLESPHLAEELCQSIRAKSDKSDYNMDELSEFLLAVQASEDLRMNVPLGQELQYDYPMPADPFQRLLDPNLKTAHLVKTKNATVLLDCGNIHNHQINLCCAGDVLIARAVMDAATDAEIIKLYYPYLHEKGIVSREQLAERRQELLDETRPLIVLNE